MNVAIVTVSAISQGLCFGFHATCAGTATAVAAAIFSLRFPKYQRADTVYQGTDMSKYGDEKSKLARQTTHSLRDIFIGYKGLMEDMLRDEGFTLPQLRLLHAVHEQRGVSGAAIARSCQVTPQTLQAMLERAVREGWIVRGTSEHNHRILVASLTRKGEELLALGMACATEIETKIWSGISAADLEAVNEALGRGIVNLNAERSARDEEKVVKPHHQSSN
jgi:MarR family transcriptional regulator, organic hydroperoxide resistance regulator